MILNLLITIHMMLSKHLSQFNFFMISIIAAIGKNNELGKNNDLLWDLPRDMKHFRDTTRGHSVIMGRKTFESIGHPLPNRRNIIISRDLDYKKEGTETVISIEDAMNLFKNSNEEIFVIGGAEIYKQLIDVVDKLYITHVDKEFPEAETFFPFIDEKKWQKTKSEKYSKDEKNKYDLEFCEYAKIS